MRRINQQVSDDECKKVLKDEKRAAFSVIDENGYPYTVPVNFFYDEEENKIYIHCAKEGHKVEILRRCDKVCFTVWNQGFKKEGHWEWNATSVVVFGKAEFVEDKDLLEKQLRKLAAKYYPTKDEIEKEMSSPSAKRVEMICIKPDHMTGKLVNEKWINNTKYSCFLSCWYWRF